MSSVQPLAVPITPITRALRTIPAGDPIHPFGVSLRRTSVNLETRTDKELRICGRDNPDPVQREYALYQLADRRNGEALPVIETALQNDPDVELRINLLWLLESIDDERSARIGTALLNDPDPRVREWAKVFAWEKKWVDNDFRISRQANFYPDRTFDETLFLHINCHLYIRLTEDNDSWGHVFLSPQMLARVYGQALACPVTSTRERELVLCKTLKGLHEDGTDHYESFLFRGFSDRTNPLSGNFYFEANTPRPFYHSGKADDVSGGVTQDVTVPFAREGQWFLNDKLDVVGGDLGAFPIEYVRGRFQGWAFVNLNRVAEQRGEYLFPGNSILSTLHHPDVGEKTNCFLHGSFKGKVLDWTGDGILDLNYLPAHATRKGEVDSNLDGVPDVPGRFVCARPCQG